MKGKGGRGFLSHFRGLKGDILMMGEVGKSGRERTKVWSIVGSRLLKYRCVSLRTPVSELTSNGLSMFRTTTRLRVWSVRRGSGTRPITDTTLGRKSDMSILVCV